MSLMRQALQGIALEEISDGKANKEIEHTFYARLTDLDELKLADSVEKQEQWEIKIPHTEGFNAVPGSIRIRKTETADGKIEYVLTTKTVGGGEGGRIEVPIPTTADNFTQFKFLSGKGMIKHRFCYSVPDSDRIWEVDVYLKPDGSYQEWCKIDFEVDSLDTPIPELPISVDRSTMITAANKNMTEAERAFVSSLYDEVFLEKNAYLKPPEFDASTVHSEQAAEVAGKEGLPAAPAEAAPDTAEAVATPAELGPDGTTSISEP